MNIGIDLRLHKEIRKETSHSISLKEISINKNHIQLSFSQTHTHI